MTATLQESRERHPFIGIDRPVIATLHLLPLPGSPTSTASLDEVVDHALAEATVLQQAGVDAVMIQNNQDHPPGSGEAPETVAAMTRIGLELRRSVPDVALGVNVLPNGTESALSIALAVQAKFVRIKVYVGSVVGITGTIEGSAFRAQAFRRRLQMSEVTIAADVYDRSSSPIASLPISVAASQAVKQGRADALVVTGLSFEESLDRARAVRSSVPRAIVLLGGGSEPQNVHVGMRNFDGIIVGQAFQDPEVRPRRIVQDRVKRYMEAAREAREA